MKPFLLRAATALAITMLLNAWQIHYGMELADEGFAWYGARQILGGEVPLRDFMAYDPGRYYLAALVMHLIGSGGIVAFRWSQLVLLVIAVFTGLSIIGGTRRLRDLPFLIAAACMLLAWMIPYYKTPDILAALLLIAGFAHVAAAGRRSAFLLAGIAIGAAAVLGRNHGVYGVVGSALLAVWLALRPEGRSALRTGAVPWAGGIVIGYLPVLLMLAVIPGFAAAFVESIRFHFDYGATNIALPVPWPWWVPATLPWEAATRAVLVGIGFIILALFAVAAFALAVYARLRGRAVSPVLVASACLAAPYAHYAYSRADTVHLAFGMMPLLIAVLASLASLRAPWRDGCAIGLAVLTLWALATERMSHDCERDPRCVWTDVGGDHLRIQPESAWIIDLLRRLAAVDPGHPIVAVPFFPSIYPALGLRSPLWEIYVLFPRRADFENKEIARMAAVSPGFVVVSTIRLDGREDLAFQSTHKLTYRWLQENFDRADDPGYPDLQIFRRRP